MMYVYVFTGVVWCKVSRRASHSFDDLNCTESILSYWTPPIMATKIVHTTPSDESQDFHPTYYIATFLTWCG